MLKTFNRTFLGFNIILVTVCACLLISIVVAAFISTLMIQNISREAFEIGTTTGTALRLSMELGNAETSQRGYLLTHDDRYIAGVDRTRSRVAIELAALRDQIHQQTDLLSFPDIAQLETTVAQKLDELQRTIELTRAGRDAEALQIVREGTGQALMERFRNMIADFQVASITARNQRISQVHHTGELLLYLTTFSALIIAALVAGIVIFILRHAREIERARIALAIANDSLAAANVDLEARVQERTKRVMRATEEVQRYAYIVSHDLRAPLVNIMGFTGEIETATSTFATYLQRAPLNPEIPQDREVQLAIEEDIPEAIGFIRASMSRMDSLIHEILKLSRLGQRTLEVVPIKTTELVEGCIETIRHRLDQADIVVTVAPDLPDVFSDRSALQQIFTNLLDNAAKYRHPDRDAYVVIHGYTAGASALFEIKDNGRGIAETDHERVFELFRRSGAQNIPGEGIGLAHVRSLARRLGGEIYVESDGTSGTTFHLSIDRDLRVRLRSKEQ